MLLNCLRYDVMLKHIFTLAASFSVINPASRSYEILICKQQISASKFSEPMKVSCPLK